MNCSKCGTKLKVVETHTRDGLKRREYCPTCRFESFVLVPKEIRELPIPSHGVIRFLANNGHAIEDIRGQTTTWVAGWEARLQKATGFELDTAAKDLRQTWPRASGSYDTRRHDDWDDDCYRINLIAVIKHMARDRVIDYEAKHKPTQASPEAAQKRQKQDANRPKNASAPEPGKRLDEWWKASL